MRYSKCLCDLQRCRFPNSFFTNSYHWRATNWWFSILTNWWFSILTNTSQPRTETDQPTDQPTLYIYEQSKAFFVHTHTGYDFTDESALKASYWYVVNTFGKLASNAGTKDFSFDSWKSHRFLLPFNLSGEDSIANPEKRRRITFRPIATANDYSLYLRFKAPTTRYYWHPLTKKELNIVFNHQN